MITALTLTRSKRPSLDHPGEPMPGEGEHRCGYTSREGQWRRVLVIGKLIFMRAGTRQTIAPLARLMILAGNFGNMAQ